MLDAANDPGRKAGAQMLGLLPEKLRPARIVRDNGDILVDGSLDALFNGVHFKVDVLRRLNLAEPVSAYLGCRAAYFCWGSIEPQRRNLLNSPMAVPRMHPNSPTASWGRHSVERLVRHSQQLNEFPFRWQQDEGQRL